MYIIKLATVVCLSTFVLFGCNRTQSAADDSLDKASAEITFKEQTYDFGNLNEGEIVEHDFEFTNTGSVPLEVIDVQVQCGCTVASRPEGLIGVGRSDKITVRFNSTGKPGINKKYVTVTANTAEPPKPIEFTATVVPAQKENV
jgi:hypothetical protein